MNNDITQMKEIRKIRFSVLYGLLFAIIGFLIGVYISPDRNSAEFSEKYFYIYSSVSCFITAWLASYFWIEKVNKYSNSRMILISIFVGLISHWLCFYLITFELNIRYWILNEHFFSSN